MQLFRTVQKKCGMLLSHEETLDIRQDIFTSLWKNDRLSGIKNPESIPYWIAIVSGNAAMQYMRKLKRGEPDSKISIFDKMDGIELSEIIPSSMLNPSEDMSRTELSTRMDKAIASLKARERMIIKLNFL